MTTITSRTGLLLLALTAACETSGSTRTSVSALDQATLGTAQDFAVLGGSTVTNTGSTVVHGNLGVDPGLSVTGFPPGLVTAGIIHAGDEVAILAQRDTTAAYITLAGETVTADLTGQDLGGQTLTPGVYHFASSAQLTGALTLDAQNDPNAVFVFQVGSTLTTASNSSIVVINGAVDCNIYWQVGSSATLGTTTSFKGNLVALTSITLDTGANVSGRALARNGAVTMDTNAVSTLRCTTPEPHGADAGVPDSNPPEIDAGQVPTVDAAVPADCAPDAPVATPDAGVPDAGCDVSLTPE